MAKRAAPNRFGIPGLGHVAADIFMKSDAPGLGPYETRPVLIVSGGGFSPGTSLPTPTGKIGPGVETAGRMKVTPVPCGP